MSICHSPFVAGDAMGWTTVRTNSCHIVNHEALLCNQGHTVSSSTVMCGTWWMEMVNKAREVD